MIKKSTEEEFIRSIPIENFGYTVNDGRKTKDDFRNNLKHNVL